MKRYEDMTKNEKIDYLEDEIKRLTEDKEVLKQKLGCADKMMVGIKKLIGMGG